MEEYVVCPCGPCRVVCVSSVRSEAVVGGRKLHRHRPTSDAPFSRSRWDSRASAAARKPRQA